MHNERPVCFCECEECPAGYPIAFAPLDVRYPPTFCKFCSTRFNYDESDVHSPPRKGIGKGDYGKGIGKGSKGDKGNGKGNGKNRFKSPRFRSNSPPKTRTYDPIEPKIDVANTMNWLASLGLAPETMLHIAKAAQGQGVGLSGLSSGSPLSNRPPTEIQLLKSAMKQAEAEFRVTQNNVKQAFAKQKKIADELQMQKEKLIQMLRREDANRDAWQLAINRYEEADALLQKQHDEEIAHLIANTADVVEEVAEVVKSSTESNPEGNADGTEGNDEPIQPFEDDAVFPDGGSEEADTTMQVQGRKRAMSGSIEGGEEDLEATTQLVDVLNTNAIIHALMKKRAGAKSPRGNRDREGDQE